MLLLPLRHLGPVLSLCLTLLTIHSTSTALPYVKAPIADMTRGLAAQDVPPSLTRPLLELFGEVEDDTWTADVGRIAAEIGRGLLEGLRGASPTVEAFMREWQEAVGDTWSEVIKLNSLEVGLDTTPPMSFLRRSS
jgi:sister chromatid cohesion protein DCC1